MSNKPTLFNLGLLVATPGALAKVTGDEIRNALMCHVCGEWGDVDTHDAQENDFSVKNNLRILSAYHTANGTKFWVITEADRSSTTILLPEEY